MIATPCAHYPAAYAYAAPTDNGKTRADGRELYVLASGSRPTKRLVIIGGLHGIKKTGIPCGMRELEKHDLIAPNGLEWANLNIVNVNGQRISSFATKDTAIRGMHGEGINFIYENIAKYSTNGSALTDEQQAKVVQLVKDYCNSGNYLVLLAWCYSGAWAITNRL